MNKKGSLDDHHEYLFIAVDRLRVSALDCAKTGTRCEKCCPPEVSMHQRNDVTDGVCPSLKCCSAALTGFVVPEKVYGFSFDQRLKCLRGSTEDTACVLVTFHIAPDNADVSDVPLCLCASVRESPGLTGRTQQSKSKAGIMPQRRESKCVIPYMLSDQVITSFYP